MLSKKGEMKNQFNYFDKVYIEESSKNTEMAKRALSLFPKDKIQIVQEDYFKKGELSASDLDKSKKTLLLKKFKGAFFKRCPGANQKMMCCNYYVLNLGQHCEMDCSYCYLQSFINFPAVVIYTNIDQALKELEDLKIQYRDQYLRIGTGEQTDSLSLDDISLNSKKLIHFFKDCPNWLLEFKTKSDNIKNFENDNHIGNVIVSWSINPEYIVTKEEHGTAPLKKRLEAAKRVRDKGFKLSFHIDPLIYHPDWETNYGELVQQITQSFSAKEVTHISLGALRFQAVQKSIMRKRFGMESLVCRGEFFRSKDGKLRYDNEIRQKMFQYMSQRLKNKGFNVFLCMETPENWLNVMESTPKKIHSLKKDFDLKITKSL